MIDDDKDRIFTPVELVNGVVGVISAFARLVETVDRVRRDAPPPAREALPDPDVIEAEIIREGDAP